VPVAEPSLQVIIHWLPRNAVLSGKSSITAHSRTGERNELSMFQPTPPRGGRLVRRGASMMPVREKTPEQLPCARQSICRRTEPIGVALPVSEFSLSPLPIAIAQDISVRLAQRGGF
jgi:hypothetical protein